MKSVLTAAVLSTLGLSAGMTQAAEFSDTAQVISATPIYDRVSNPRRECVNEPVTTYEDRRVRRDVPDSTYEQRRYEQRDQRVEREGTGAGAVLGAIIGGVIGHQFGNSSGGRDRGAAAGAILGGVIGNQVEKDSGSYDNRYDTRSDSPYRRSRYDVERVPVTRDVQRCNVVNDTREEVRGYDVRYRYNGRDYTTRMSYDPGPTIPVQVDVRPTYRANNYSNRY